MAATNEDLNKVTFLSVGNFKWGRYKLNLREIALSSINVLKANLAIIRTSQMFMGQVNQSAGILTQRVAPLLTVAGQRRTYTGLSPLRLAAVPH